MREDYYGKGDLDEFVEYHQNSFPQLATPRSSARAKPVRLSVDLSPELYRSFTQLSRDLADQVDVARVPHVAIIRALVCRVVNDPHLQEQILTDMRQSMV